ncbi:response regulator [Govanella unica]|uniref:histidine kinase n=1 Tax=Govanella unica TaxID=2975056 RepID=A0A9X3TXM8_9PROT|nr:response regulator [Govania unica]MDA5193237.1 response regulator [Govania unica]
MRDEATAVPNMKAPSRRGLAGEGTALRRGLFVGVGLMIAVTSAGGAWYLTLAASEWLAGGVLAGIALACALFAIVTLLRESVGSVNSGDATLLFTALDMTMNGRVITDAAGVVTYANPAYRDMTGIKRGVAPSPIELVEGNASGMAAIARLLELAKTGGQGQEAVRLTLAHCGTRWLRFSASDTGGVGGTIVWQVVDVTNAAAVRDGAREAREVAGHILDAVGSGALSFDDQLRVRAINVTLSRWLGVASPASLAGEPLSSLLDEPVTGIDGLAVLAGRTLAFKGRHGALVNLEVAYADTVCLTELPSRAGVLVLRNPAEQSERLGVGDEAGEAARFRRYFADAPLGIATVDLTGQVYASNNLFQNIFSAGGGAGGQLLSEIIVAVDLPDVLARIREAIEKGGVPAPVEVRFMGSGEKQAQLYVHRLESGAGLDERAVLYVIDTTDQKNLEMQFAQSQKMQAVGQLAGGIAHDFNNLLTAITGFCDLLLVRHGPGDQSFADIMQVKQNANRAANLVRQLLAFSRQQTLRPKVLIITDVLAEISNLLRRLIGETIELKMIHGRNLGPVKVDQGQLEQVIINLAVNARDAMPTGGTLAIRTSDISSEDSRTLGHPMMPMGAYVMIEVSDTGTGIAKENLGKIFEPFFSTKEVGKGTGLGLSTVYGIVKQTGGFIFPDSSPGQGAIFRIYLPKYAGEVEQREVVTLVERPKDLTGKGNILLVEDEDAVRLFASRALKNKGYNVLEADSGEQALALVEKHGDSINLLISDVVMPNMDGPTLVQNIRERRYGMKIIFISGYAEDAFRKNLGKGAEFSFLPKPFSLKQLAEKVKDVLEDV